MKQNAGTSNRQILAQLRKTDHALTGKTKNQPVIVYRHGRWHMLNIGIVINPRMKARQGIVNVHFMSLYRARKTILEWLPYSKLSPFEAICSTFAEELAAKVLPAAEDYRSLLQKGGVVLAGGYTTDTLHSIGNTTSTEDLLIARIESWMKAGEMGPFLHFERTYDVFLDRAARK